MQDWPQLTFILCIEPRLTEVPLFRASANAMNTFLTLKHLPECPWLTQLLINANSEASERILNSPAHQGNGLMAVCYLIPCQPSASQIPKAYCILQGEPNLPNALGALLHLSLANGAADRGNQFRKSLDEAFSEERKFSVAWLKRSIIIFSGDYNNNGIRCRESFARSFMIVHCSA